MIFRATLRRSTLYGLAIAAVQALAVLAAIGQPVTDYSTFPASSIFVQDHQLTVEYGALAVRGQHAYVLGNPLDLATTNPRIIRTFAWDASPLVTSCADITVTSDANSSLIDVLQHGSWLYVAVSNLGSTSNSIKVYSLAEEDGAPTLVQSRSLSSVTPKHIRLMIASNDDAYLLAEEYVDPTTRLSCYALDPTTGEVAATVTSAVQVTPNIYDIVVTGDTAVIAEWYGYPAVYRVRAMNYADPADPLSGAPTATYNIPERLAVGLDGTTIFVGESIRDENEVRSEVFSLGANQYGPALSHVTNFSHNAGTFGFACDGTVLFAGTDNAFSKFDVTNPASPVALPSCCLGEEAAAHLVPFAGSVLATGNAGHDFSVFRVNVATPIVEAAAFSTYGTYDIGDALAYKRHGGTEEYCYVANDNGIGVMYLVGSGAVHMGTVLGTPVRSLAWGGANLLVACTGSANAHLLDVGSDPSAPAFIATMASTGTTQGAAVFGNRLYLAAGSAGVEVWDITDPAHPSRLWIVSAAASARAISVRRQGGVTLAYVACGASGMKVINVTSSGLTNPVGQVGTTNAERIVLRGNYAYVADRSGGVRVVDISTYSNPTLVSPGIAAHDALGVALMGNGLYVADGRTVHVYDIASPSAPSYGGFLDVGVDVMGLAVSGRVWAAGGSKLYVAYVQSGAKPNIIASSEVAASSANPETGAAVWTMSWRSHEWSDPDLLEVDLWDWILDEGCRSYGSDPGTALAYGDLGVETEVVPAIEGGFWNILRFDTGECAAVCKYTLRGRCAVIDWEGYQTTSSNKRIEQTFCIGE